MKRAAQRFGNMAAVQVSGIFLFFVGASALVFFSLVFILSVVKLAWRIAP